MKKIRNTVIKISHVIAGLRTVYSRKKSSVKTTIIVVALYAVILIISPIAVLEESIAEFLPATTATPANTSAPAPITELEADLPEELPPSSTSEPKAMLPHLEPLYQKNNDLAGWFKIDGTVVDYPVMYTPNAPGFYLSRTFEKEDDPSGEGELFVDENCTLEPRSSNLIIHGHNMRSGTMFATLLKYKDEDFYKQHPTFTFSTLYEIEEYEIVSVFLSKIYRKTDDVFKYYQFYDAQTEDEFDYYIDNIKKLQLYDTGVTASFGDLLITLTTCEYSQDNGRMVIVGRRVIST